MRGTGWLERGKSQFNHVAFCDILTFIFASESGPHNNVRAKISLGKTRRALIIDPSCHPNPHEQIYPMDSCFLGQFSGRALRLTRMLCFYRTYDHAGVLKSIHFLSNINHQSPRLLDLPRGSNLRPQHSVSFEGHRVEVKGRRAAVCSVAHVDKGRVAAGMRSNWPEISSFKRRGTRVHCTTVMRERTEESCGEEQHTVT